MSLIPKLQLFIDKAKGKLSDWIPLKINHQGDTTPMNFRVGEGLTPQGQETAEQKIKDIRAPIKQSIFTGSMPELIKRRFHEQRETKTEAEAYKNIYP